MRASLSPQALVRTTMPALAVECDVFRKQARRTHLVYWNPLGKALEPMCCAGCGASIFWVYVSDLDVRPLADCEHGANGKPA